MTIPTITAYDPTGSPTAGMSAIWVLDAVADLNAPKVAEFDGALAIQCAMEEFGITKEVSWQSRKKLCDRVATQKPGEMTYGFSSELRIALNDPQGATQPAMDALVEGATVYLVHRPGMTHGTAPDAAQKVQVVKAIVGTTTIAPVTTEEGEEYEAVVALGVQDMNEGLLVAIAA